MSDPVNRRRFLQASATCAAAGAICGEGFAAQPSSGSLMLNDDGHSAAKVAPRDRYLNPNAVPFEVPVFKGDRYEAMVPDTLDLAEMARKLIHAMTAPTDPEIDYEVYWWAVFGTNPPHMRHQFSDLIQFQYTAVMPHMRLISGSTEGAEVEKGFLAGTVKNLGADGLFYNMPKARPWVAAMDQSFPPADKPPAGAPFANLLQSCVVLNMLNTYMQISADNRWRETAQRLVDTFVRLAVDKGESAYYHKWQYLQGEPRGDGSPPKDFYRGWCDAIIMLPLLQFHSLTGNEPAATLARKLLNSYMRSYTGYEANGNIIQVWNGATYGGFPLWASLNPMEWALRTGDRAMLQVASQNYERYRKYVEQSTGYYPEVLHFANPGTLHTAESCFLAYVVANAVLLAAAGAGDYWDDVDCWVRNQFAEAQLNSGDWVERLVKGKAAQAVPPYATSERVVERNLGAFAGAMQFNDWFGGYVHPVARDLGGMAIQHCCTARGAVAIYNVWKNIVQCEAGTLRVNLMLNRASKWADIDSHIPYVGQVDVRIKQALKLEVRIPGWVKPAEVQARIDGERREITFAGRYARLGDVKPGQVATLTFPIAERDQSAVVHGRTYSLRIKGNTVVAIDPPGDYCPVYQREHYRGNTTRWRKAQRFIGESPFKEDHAIPI